MEYADGGDADQMRMANDGRLPVAAVANILLGVAQALAYLHERNVVHRDVKPPNIMFADGTVKLGDFGLAKVFERTLSHHTGAGTIAYCAPEMLQGHVGSSSDIWALGATAYELLCGRLPFEASTPIALMYQIAANEPDWSLLPDGPLSELTQSMMLKEPAGRPSAHEVIVTLSAKSPPPTQRPSPLRASEKQSAPSGGGSAERMEVFPLAHGETIEMVWIEPGTFIMGSPLSEADRDDDEQQHQVTLTKGFWLGKFEVTQRQWNAVMGNNPSFFKGDTLPVEQVSWDDIQGFLHEIDEPYRLPSEAEWEYACRAGTTDRFAGTGNLDSMGWHITNSVGKSHPVGQKQPNAWGLHDMHGNVWEWCEDTYDEDSYTQSPELDPLSTSGSDIRVFRGGSWYSRAKRCRSAIRSGLVPSDKRSNIGFRLAKNP